MSVLHISVEVEDMFLVVFNVMLEIIIIVKQQYYRKHIVKI